jgi:hypothetical protein
MFFVDAESVRRMHNDTVERVNRDGYKLAYRDEAARLRRRERATDGLGRSPRGFTLLAGLRRLRLA